MQPTSQKPHILGILEEMKIENPSEEIRRDIKYLAVFRNHIIDEAISRIQQEVSDNTDIVFDPPVFIKKGDAMLISFPREYIVCSAVWIKEIQGTHRPKNIDSGYVVAGLRHHNCIETISMMKGSRDHNGKPVDCSNQWFLTSHNRYISRKEALIMAKENWQFIGPQHGNILYSENIY